MYDKIYLLRFGL